MWSKAPMEALAGNCGISETSENLIKITADGKEVQNYWAWGH